jgi:MFS family permease
MPPLPTWTVAAGSLLVGFGVADLTGVRALGAIVLFLAALWCGLRWKAARGLGVAVALVVVYLVGFALSHPLGHAIGSWPAVAVVAVVVGAVVWAVADRPARLTAVRRPTHREPA